MTNFDLNNLASQLVKYRETHNLSQQQLAALLVVDQATVSRLESGKKPTMETAMKLIRILAE